MTDGDVFTGEGTIAAGEYLDGTPASGNEASIHNIYHEGSVSLERYNGLTGFTFDTDTDEPGIYAFHIFHVTPTHRIRIKNLSGSAKWIAFDGMYTK